MKGSLYAFINCIIILLSVFLCFNVDNNFDLANYHFYLFIVLCIIVFYRYRTFSFQILWLLSFIFILLSEMLTNEGALMAYHWEHKFIFLANDAILLGYHFTRRNKMIIKETPEINEFSWFFVFFIGLFYAIFMVYQFPIAIISMRIGGRSYADEMTSTNEILTAFMGSYRVLPLILGYYIVRINKGSKWIALLLSAPIFFLMMFNGSRFRLLFSLLPFLLICDFFQISNITLKQLVKIVIFISLLLFVVNFMMQTRRGGLQNLNANKKELVTGPRSNYLSVRLCKEGSPENIIPVFNYIKAEVEANGYTHGKSTGFIFYFWIPRAIWPEKPVQLNAWIPQKYMTGVGEGFSSSSGFCGEPFADFGYFSFIVFFLMGFGFKKADNYLLGTEYGKKRCIHSLFAAILIPGIPFMIRSPVTATFSTIWNGLFIYLFYVFFFKKKSST